MISILLFFHFQGASSTILIVNYLEPYTLYTFRVLAFHQAGNGVSSAYVDARTMEGSTFKNIIIYIQVRHLTLPSGQNRRKSSLQGVYF